MSTFFSRTAGVLIALICLTGASIAFAQTMTFLPSTQPGDAAIMVAPLLPAAHMPSQRANGVRGQYTAADLGRVNCLAMNNKGEIVGWRRGPHGTRPFYYSAGAEHDIPASADFYGGSPFAGEISDQGSIEICGMHLKGRSNVAKPAFAMGTRKGLSLALPQLGEGQPSYVSIRNGIVAGSIDGPGDPTAPSGHLFLIKNGKITWSAPGAFKTLEVVNGKGDVVGCMFKQQRQRAPSEPLEQAFLWSGGKVTKLPGVPGYSKNEALAINDRSEIVGDAWINFPSGSSALWIRRGGSLKILKAFQHRFPSSALLNNAGEIAVMFWPSEQGDLLSLLYEHGRWIDLNDAVNLPAGDRIGSIVALNDRGQMVVRSYPRGHEYLLTPKL